METPRTLLMALLAIEALLFVPGLPAWGFLTGASQAAQAYLFCMGMFSAVAVVSLQTCKAYGRIWAWAAGVSKLPIVHQLTPFGIIVIALLLTLHFKLRAGRGRWSTCSSALRETWWVWLFALGFCWAGAWQVHLFSQLAGLPPISYVLLFGGLWLALPVFLLAHCGGHWLAGKSTDLQIIGAWSGWADPQPAHFQRESLRPRLLLWTLCGPLASLALGAFLLTVLITSPGTAWSGVGEIAGLGAVCSLAIFFTSMLPWRAFGYRSDGAALVSIARHGAEYRRDRAIALIAGDWLRGVAPRDWNPRHLRAAVEAPDLSRQHATACGLNYMYCLDRGFDASARYWIGRLATEFENDRLAVPVRWKLETAFYLAAFDGSGRVAEAPVWRRSAGRAAAIPRALRLRSGAALAVARGQAERAGELIWAAERAALGNPGSSLFAFEMDLLNRLRDRIEPAMPSVGSLPNPLVAVGPFDRLVPDYLQ